MHFAMGCVLIKIFCYQKPKDAQRRIATFIVVGLTAFIVSLSKISFCPISLKSNPLDPLITRPHLSNTTASKHS